MKKFLKSAGLPIGVFALAIGSAFATNAMKSSLALEQGYQKIDNDGLVCRDRIMCDSGPGPVCTWNDGINTHILYGMEFNKDLNETVCTKTLSRIR